MDNTKKESLTPNNEQIKHELKDIYEEKPINDDNSNSEEIPKEVQMFYNKPTNSDYLEEKKKDLISETESNAGQPIGKKEMDTILLSLNPYWIELIASIGVTISLIIYEALGLLGLNTLFNFLDSSGEDLMQSISALLDLISALGIKSRRAEIDCIKSQLFLI